MAENEELQNLTEEKAFRDLGRALLAGTFGASRLTDSEAEESGRAWYKSVLPVLKERICGNEAITKLLRTEDATLRNAVLVAAVDAALQGVFASIPITTITHAVVVYGLHRLCGGSVK
jgi:hypothetical protein